MMKEFTIIQRHNRTSEDNTFLTFSIGKQSSVNFVHHHINDDLDVFIDGYVIDETLKDNRITKKNYPSYIDEVISIVNFKEYEKLAMFNGHYNFIICDNRQNQVIVIADRYGMRPLFWFKSINITIISNSFSAICNHDRFDDQINFEAIADFLKFEWVTNDATFFKKINRISAGTVNYFNKNGLEVKRYYAWPAEPERNNKSVEENAGQGYDFLYRAVKRVIKGLSSPGVTLSGGLDSRVITGLSNKMGLRPYLYHCYMDSNEYLGAQGVANAYHMNLVTGSPLRLSCGIDRLPILYGDGCTSINQFWLNGVYKKIADINETDCIIDGFILDLLLNSLYTIYNYQPRTTKERGLFTDKDKVNVANIIYGLPKGYFIKYFKGSRILNINEIALENIRRQCSLINSSDIVHYCRGLYLMTRGKRYIYMMSYINQQYCDIRFPGLDYDLIDFCIHLPTNQFRHPLVYLKIFDKYFQELNEIIWAKTGEPLKDGINDIKRYNKFLKDLKYIVKRATFGRIDLETSEGDYNRMFRNDKSFRDSIIHFLSEGQCKRNGIVNQGGLERLFSDIYTGRNNFFILERLLTVELFFRSFVLGITIEDEK